MPKKKTQREVLAEFLNAHGNRYDYSLVSYINTNTKIKVICSKHGIFEITPGHHKKGVGCRQCYFNSQKTTKEDFVLRSRNHFGNIYDYSLFDKLPLYGEKVPIICIKHGERFLQEPRNHLKGHTGCSVCKSLILSGSTESKKEKKKSPKIKTQKDLTKEFIKRSQEVHNIYYDYSAFKYLNSSTKGKIICHTHGEFWQTPSNHLKGHNCPKCAVEKKKENTFKKLCKEKKVDYYRALKRRQAGLSEEKIFKQDFIRNFREVNLIEIYGETYPNLEEAVRVLQPAASSATIRRWIKEGITSEEAFERIPNPGYANGFIYLITNKVTNKQYVGLTIQTIKRRWKYHLEQAKANQIKHDNSLHSAIREYGKEVFDIMIIDRGTTKKDLESKERYWIEELNTLIPNGYNICTGGVNGGSNKKPTIVDGIRFESVNKAAEYVARSRDIAITAAKKRISLGKIDVRKPAKPGESLVQTKTYKTWSRIIHCVLNANSKDYNPKIDIVDRWRNFDNFFTDVGLPPEEGMAFARLDKTRGFFPDNCKWTTKSEASRINALYMKNKGLFRKKSR